MRRLLNSTARQRCGSKLANTDMVEGFRDGYDLSAPEPSGNRSNSYRHGFMVGRRDRRPADEQDGYSADQLRRMADEAMEADEPRGVQRCH